jgi:DNA-binding Lrp family transcriptional regulator
MKVNRDFKGVWIPKSIYLDERLSWTEKILLVEVDSLDQNKGCFASNGYLANFLGVSEWTVSNSISKLKKLGYLKTQMLEGRKRIIKSLVKTTRQSLGKPKGSVVKNPKHSNTVNKTDSNKGIDQKELLFEQFWLKYNKKVGKTATKKKFLKLPLEKIQKCLSIIDEYVKSTPDVKYRKHPVTWLNQECWEDEIIKENTTKIDGGLIINTENGKIII